MSKYILGVLFMMLMAGAASGQDYKKLMKKGEKHYNRGEINQALEYFLEAEKLEQGNVDLTLHIGRAYLSSDYKHHA